MLHLPQFEPIWVVMHMGRPSVQVRHAIKTAVSWLIRAALGQLWCLFGSFGWCVKITRPTRSTHVWPELLCRWFCCSHYSCYYISICVFVQPAHAVARQSTFCSFVFAAIHTYSSESLFSVCLRICCSQRLQGRVQPSGNKHLIHLSGLIWWKCQNTIFTYGEISSDMLFWCFNKQFKSGERLQHWHYLCG